MISLQSEANRFDSETMCSLRNTRGLTNTNRLIRFVISFRFNSSSGACPYILPLPITGFTSFQVIQIFIASQFHVEFTDC